MNNRLYRRKTRLLFVLMAVAATYSIWFQKRHVLTGNPIVDGTVSILVGLYICSLPATNAIDLFFFQRISSTRVITAWSSVSWLVLNVLTLLMGWSVIYIGTTLLTGRTD